MGEQASYQKITWSFCLKKDNFIQIPQFKNTIKFQRNNRQYRWVTNRWLSRSKSSCYARSLSATFHSKRRRNYPSSSNDTCIEFKTKTILFLSEASALFFVIHFSFVVVLYTTLQRLLTKDGTFLKLQVSLILSRLRQSVCQLKCLFC